MCFSPVALTLTLLMGGGHLAGGVAAVARIDHVDRKCAPCALVAVAVAVAVGTQRPYEDAKQC